MKFAHYDPLNMQLLGWYDDEIHQNIPTPSIGVTSEIYENSINNNLNKVSLTGFFSKEDFRTLDVKISDARKRRDDHLKQLDVIVSNPLRWADLSDDEKNQCILYRKKLLEIPQQPNFPENIDWGNPPSFTGIKYRNNQVDD